MKTFSVREVSGGYIIETSEQMSLEDVMSKLPEIPGADDAIIDGIKDFTRGLGVMGKTNTREIVASDKDELLAKVKAIIGSW